LARLLATATNDLGRRATIDLLDDMNQLGFRESTRSGLSFGTDDLVTPEVEARLAEAEKEVMKLKKSATTAV
jgi:DNA-directed RNA polymerase subunit beta'